MDGNYESLARGMLENQMRAGLAGAVIALPEKKPDKFASGDHLVHCEGDGLGVDGARLGNGLALFPAMLNVQAHGLQDAFLGLFDGLAEAIDARKVVAVSVIALAFAFDGDGVTVESHAKGKLTTKLRPLRMTR